MARRAKKTEAQDNTNGAAAPAHGPGHNGGGHVVDESTYFKHVRNIEAAERRKDKAVQELRQARKEAKGDGVKLAEMDTVRKFHKYSEPELADQFNTIAAYAKYMNTPVYSQIAMFSFEEPNDEGNLKKARDMGLTAGKRGDSFDKNPWPLETPMGREWASAFKEGDQALQDSFKGKPAADPAQPTLA